MPDVDPVEQNLRRALSAFAGATGIGECRQMPGLLIASAGIGCAVFNAALLAPPAAASAGELERRLLSAAVHYQARGLPWSFWLAEDLVEREVRREAERILTRCGLVNIAVCPGMIADRLEPPRSPAPDVEFRPTVDPEARTAFCYVMAAAFVLPFETARAIYGAEHLWREGFQGWVGYVNDDPVTTAAVISSGDVVGVYAVATMPAWRKRGYAEAITRYALDQARRSTGIERSVLQSTREGLSLYRKMGYRQTTRVAVYQSR
jgi:GNAT superfamily N-acetyltransferase